LGRLDIVKLLVERGADVNAKNGDGKTPLDLAREKKYWDIVYFLEKAAKGAVEVSEMPNKAVVELLEEIGSKNKLEIARAEGQTGEGKICPYCGSPLYHISLTNEYYCFVCKKYVA